MNSFYKFCRAQKCNKEEVKEAYEYFLTKKTEAEQSSYLNMVYFYAKEYLTSDTKRREKLKIIYEKKYGIDEYFLNLFITLYIKTTDNIKALINYIEIKNTNKEQFLSKIYLDVINNTNLSEIASLNNFNVKGLIEIAVYYAKTYLLISEEDAINLKRKLECKYNFYNYVNKKEAILKKVKEYYYNYATLEEKAKYSKIIDEALQNKNSILNMYDLGLMLLNDTPFLDIKEYILTNNLRVGTLTNYYLDIFIKKYVLENGGDEAFIKEQLLNKLAIFNNEWQKSLNSDFKRK